MAFRLPGRIHWGLCVLLLLFAIPSHAQMPLPQSEPLSLVDRGEKCLLPLEGWEGFCKDVSKSLNCYILRSFCFIALEGCAPLNQPGIILGTAVGHKAERRTKWFVKRVKNGEVCLRLF
jgi:hypothetical protein